MFRVMRFVALAAVTALAVPAGFAAGPQKAGKWENTVKVEMTGMNIPPTTTTACVTEDDLKDPSKTVPSGGPGQNGNCKVSDYKIDGNKVSWTMKCDGEHPVTAAGQMTFSGDSYAGSMTMSAQGHDISMTMSGKRLGDCQK